MNKEEIKHFKAMLRQGSLRHMNILLDDKFQKELLNIIKDYEKIQQENQSLKDRIEKANILTKRIKNDVFERMAECYENEDEWNGDFLNTEINSIDRLSDLLKGGK